MAIAPKHVGANSKKCSILLAKCICWCW